MLCSPLLRVHLLIDATHALLTYALVVSVNTGTAEYTFTVQQKGDNKSKKKEKENVARGAKGGGWGKENRTGPLGPGPIRGHSTQWGKELQPTEHQPATLHGVMGLMGHF